MIEAVLFDLDGTIYLGDRALAGAAYTVAQLRAAERRTFFLSNNPTRSRTETAAKLTRLGIPTEVEDVVNSSFVFVRWLLTEAPEATLFVVGEAPLIADLTAAGFDFSEEAAKIDFVVASFDRTFDYRKLQIAFDAVRAGARLVATNGDAYCPVPGGGEPDAAAVIAAIEASSGVRCHPIVGKPSPIMVSTISDLLGLPAGACMMVGDRLETDIQMGIDAGMATCLVLTGDATRESLEASGLQPTLVVERIDQLLTADELRQPAPGALP